MKLELDYSFTPKPRYGHGSSPHPRLHAIIESGRSSYSALLGELVSYAETALQISPFGIVDPALMQLFGQPLKTMRILEAAGKLSPEDVQLVQEVINASFDAPEPGWINHWLPALDAFTLYSLLAKYKPQRYVEIGSGNSTKFTRRAIQDFNLTTHLTSIDPEPRASINDLCDAVIREPFENVDLSLFDDLGDGDIVFFDGSHRVFTNSDTTVMLLEVFPNLKPGVLVHFHDIFLPHDYPADLNDRYYSEQYVLAAYLLAEGNKFEILLPNFFISQDAALMELLNPFFNASDMDQVGRNGASFWLRMR